MKQDIDKLMEEKKIDALRVAGTPDSCPEMLYFTGNIAINGGMLIKKRNSEPVLIVSGLERDEAAKSGLVIKTWNDFDAQKITKESANNLEGGFNVFKNLCKKLDISGNVSFYGFGNIAKSYQMIKKIEQSKIVNVITEMENTVIGDARITKDQNEINKLVDVNNRAQKVISTVRNYLSSCRKTPQNFIKNETDQIVTIGMIKEIIRKESLKEGLVIKEEFVFSQGRDSAVPHSIGADNANLVTGKTIVFDYFPHDKETGYYADITRTWCLGHIPREVEEIYQHVIEAHTLAIKSIKLDTSYMEIDKIVSEKIAEHGHPTLLNGKAENDGYFHSLGHGIGLALHESPSVYVFSKIQETVKPGHAFTIEPGIYYPDKEIGIRVEDDVVILHDGSVCNLTEDLSKDLLVHLAQ